MKIKHAVLLLMILLWGVDETAYPQSPATKFTLYRGQLLWSAQGPCSVPSAKCRPLFLQEYREGIPSWSFQRFPNRRTLFLKKADPEKVITQEIRQELDKQKIPLSKSISAFTIDGSKSGMAIDPDSNTTVLVQPYGVSDGGSGIDLCGLCQARGREKRVPPSQGRGANENGQIMFTK